MMQKLFTLTALTAACLAAGVAQADDSGITVNGRLDVSAESVKAGASTSGAGEQSQKRLSSNSSFIRFRGTENLGAEGLKAWFQVESGIRQDGDTIANSGWSTRNSGVGLEGQFGTWVLGQWDTPYKFSTNGVDMDVFNATNMATYESIIGNGATTNGNNNNSSFQRRQRNVIQYWTPNISGFSGRLAAGSAEDTPTGRGRLLSGMVSYRNGPVYVSAAHEIHKSYQGSNKDDKGTRLGGQVKFGPLTLNSVWERLQYEPITGDIKRNAWFVGTMYQIGAASLRAQYAKANSGTGTSIPGCATPALCQVGNVSNLADSGAKQFSVGGVYGFSKRTDIYTYYTRIDNEKNGTYNFDTNAFNPTTATSGGSDRTGLALGVQHRF